MAAVGMENNCSRAGQIAASMLLALAQVRLGNSSRFVQDALQEGEELCRVLQTLNTLEREREFLACPFPEDVFDLSDPAIPAPQPSLKRFISHASYVAEDLQKLRTKEVALSDLQLNTLTSYFQELASVLRASDLRIARCSRLT